MRISVGVFGVPGIGKTTLLKAHIKAFPVDKYIDGSSVIKAIISPSFISELDTWSLQKQNEVRTESIYRLRKMKNTTKRALLVTGHFSLRNRSDKHLKSILTAADHSFFDVLVHLDGKATTILQQTLLNSRKRHDQSLRFVDEHLLYERILAEKTAKIMKVPFLRIVSEAHNERLHQLAKFLEIITKTKCQL